jgi:Domain of unknown function (DUF4390)
MRVMPTLKLLIVISMFALAAARATADDIEVQAATLAANDEGIVLNADFALELTSRLEDALAKGVPLYFVVEFECYRPRWYWFDQRVGAATLSLRLSFHALTRTYRLTTGTLHRSYATLNEAIRALAHVREWQVLPRASLKSDARYYAYVRMRLDTAQLPKPFQVSALANREWILVSEWKKWDVKGAIPVSEAER